MKKCLHILLALCIVGLYCARGAAVFCAPDTTTRRVLQIERAILKESRTLRSLQKRYEHILKRQRTLRAFLEQKRRRDRKRVIEITLIRIKRWEAKEKAMRGLLGKQR